MNYKNVQIVSKDDAQHLAFKKPNYYCFVSIGSSSFHDEFPRLKFAKHVVRLNFSDLELHHDDNINKKYIEMGYVLPTWKEIKKGLDFANLHKNEPLIFHCHAGVSRSPAMCLLALFNEHKNMGDALDELWNIKKFSLIHPNKYIMRLGLQNLTSNVLEFDDAYLRFHNAFGN